MAEHGQVTCTVPAILKQRLLYTRGKELPGKYRFSARSNSPHCPSEYSLEYTNRICRTLSTSKTVTLSSYHLICVMHYAPLLLRP